MKAMGACRSILLFFSALIVCQRACCALVTVDEFSSPKGRSLLQTNVSPLTPAANCPANAEPPSGTYGCCTDCCRFDESLYLSASTSKVCATVDYNNQENTLTIATACGYTTGTDPITRASAALSSCHFRYCNSNGVCGLYNYTSSLFANVAPVDCPLPKSVSQFVTLTLTASLSPLSLCTTSLTGGGVERPEVLVPVPVCTTPKITCDAYELFCTPSNPVPYTICRVNQDIPLQTNALVSRYEDDGGVVADTLRSAPLPCPAVAGDTIALNVLYEPASTTIPGVLPVAGDAGCGGVVRITVTNSECDPTVVGLCTPNVGLTQDNPWICGSSAGSTPVVPIFDAVIADSLCQANVPGPPFLVNGLTDTEGPYVVPCPPPVGSLPTKVFVQVSNLAGSDPATCLASYDFYLQDIRCVPELSIQCNNFIIACTSSQTSINLDNYCTYTGGSLQIIGGGNPASFSCPAPCSSGATCATATTTVNLQVTNTRQSLGDATCQPQTDQLRFKNTDCSPAVQLSCDTDVKYCTVGQTFDLTSVCRLLNSNSQYLGDYTSVSCPAPTASTDNTVAEFTVIAVAVSNNGGANCQVSQVVRLKNEVCLHEPDVFGCNNGLTETSPMPCSLSDPTRSASNILITDAGCATNQFTLIPSTTYTAATLCPKAGDPAKPVTIDLRVQPQYGGLQCSAKKTVTFYYRNTDCNPDATITCDVSGPLPCTNGQINLTDAFSCRAPGGNFLQPEVIACPDPPHVVTTVTLRAEPRPNPGGQFCQIRTATLQVVTQECTPAVNLVNCEFGLTNSTPIACPKTTSITGADADAFRDAILQASQCTLTGPGDVLGGDVTFELFSGNTPVVPTAGVDCDNLAEAGSVFTARLGIATCTTAGQCDLATCYKDVSLWFRRPECVPAVGFTGTAVPPFCQTIGAPVDLKNVGLQPTLPTSQFTGTTVVACPASLAKQTYPLTVGPVVDRNDPSGSCLPATQFIEVTNNACIPKNGLSCPAGAKGLSQSTAAPCTGTTVSPASFYEASGCASAFADVDSDLLDDAGTALSTCDCPTLTTLPSQVECRLVIAPKNPTGISPTVNCTTVTRQVWVAQTSCDPALGSFTCTEPLECTGGPITFTAVTALNCVADGTLVAIATPTSGPVTQINCPAPGQTGSALLTYSVDPINLDTSLPFDDTCQKTFTITVKNTACAPPISTVCPSSRNPITCTSPGATVSSSTLGAACDVTNGVFIGASVTTCPAYYATQTTELTYRNSAAVTPYDPVTCESKQTRTLRNIGCPPFMLTCSSSTTSPVQCVADLGASVPVTSGITSGLTPACSVSRTNVVMTTVPATVLCPPPGQTSTVTVNAEDSILAAPKDPLSCNASSTVILKNIRCAPKPQITCTPSVVPCTQANLVFDVRSVCQPSAGSVLINSTVRCPAPTNSTTAVLLARLSNATVPFEPASCETTQTITVRNIACTCRPTITCSAGVGYPTNQPIICTTAGQTITVSNLCTVSNGSFITTTITCPGAGVLSIANVTALSVEVTGSNPQPGVDYDPNTCASQVQIAIKNTICSPTISPINCPSVINCTQAGVIINGDVLSQCSGGGTLGTLGLSQCPQPGQNITITVTGRNLTAGSPFDTATCVAANLNVTVKNIACEPPVVLTCSAGNTAATAIPCTGGTVNIQNVCTFPSLTTPAVITSPPNPASVACPVVPPFSQPVINDQVILRAEAVTNNGDPVTCTNTRRLFLKNNQCNPQIRVFCTPRTCSTSNSWSIAPCTTTVNGILIKNDTFNFAFKCPTTPGQVQTVTVCARKNNTYTNDDPATCFACNSTTITNTDCITPTADCPASISCTNGVLPAKPCNVNPSNAVQTFPTGTTCPGGRLCTTVTITSPGSGGSRCTITRNILLFGSTGGAEILPDQLCNPAVNSCVNGFRCIAVNSGPDVLCAPGGSNCYCKPNPTCVPTSTTSLGVKGLNEQCGGGFGFCSAASVCGQEYCPRSICYACSAGTCTCQADGLFCYCK